MDNKENKFTQLCVLRGVTVEGKPEAFEAHILKEFGARIKFADEVTTLPDVRRGKTVPGTGGRLDILFYIHDDDISKFAIPRLMAGISWWEDALSNGDDKIYTDELLAKYPRTW